MNKRKKVLKVFFVSILFAFASGANVFCDEYRYEDYTNGKYNSEKKYYDEDEFEPGCSFEFGGGLASTIVGKAYSYADINLLYNFNEYSALGAGVKGYLNLVPNFDEAPVYYIPYAMYRIKIVNLKAGLVFYDENKDLRIDYNPYFDVSFSLPVWKVGSGKIGFELGSEFWFSLFSFRSENSYKNDPEGLGGAIEDFATVFGTIMNSVKFYAGIKYYL